MDNSTVLICSAGDHLSVHKGQTGRWPYRQSRTFQDIQAYPSELVLTGDEKRLMRCGGQLTDVRVINLGEESHLWRCHWVFFRQEQFQLEYTPFIACEWRANRERKEGLTLERTPIRPLDGHIEVAQVIVMRQSSDSWSGVCDETFGFL